MANHTKNQHYVPQFLLKNFSSDCDCNQIWCYDKKWRKIKSRSISKVAKEDYLYDSVRGQKEGSWEYFFSSAETDTASIIKKVLDAENLDALTIDDKSTLALFIILQNLRTKAAFIDTEQHNFDFVAPIKKLAETMNLKYNYEDIDSKKIWLKTFEYIPTFSTYLINKVWILFKSDGEFYTSDNPVVKQNTTNKNHVRGTLGINSDGIEIYLPLNSSVVLCLLCEKTYKELYGKSIFCNPAGIENINSLQVINSERFVFSAKKNYELVEDMINKGEA